MSKTTESANELRWFSEPLFTCSFTDLDRLALEIGKQKEVVPSSIVLPSTQSLLTKTHEKDKGLDAGLEDEAVGARKAALAKGASNSKKSRAAASEKRRRIKINEKLRELQKLIPNCTKVDTASVLDEAIEYTKKLQLQTKILSLRNGYMPLMMLPPHMQQIQAAYVPPFSPMGLGMGMGMDLGMSLGMGMVLGMSLGMGLEMGVGMDALAQVPVEQGTNYADGPCEGGYWPWF